MVSKFHFGNYILGEIIKEEQNLLHRRYDLKQGKARNTPHVTQEPGQAGYINVKENMMTPHICSHRASRKYLSSADCVPGPVSSAGGGCQTRQRRPLSLSFPSRAETDAKHIDE